MPGVADDPKRSLTINKASQPTTFSFGQFFHGYLLPYVCPVMAKQLSGNGLAISPSCLGISYLPSRPFDDREKP